MKYEKPYMEMIELEKESIITDSLKEDPNEGTTIPGLPGLSGITE